MKKITGAEMVVECLKAEGVEYIFGYPGAATIQLHDCLLDSDIKFILPRHEQAAGHAADGYARSTGKVGVCLTTSGPGATNLVTALATAYMDSVPMIAITGQVATNAIGTDAFQEADMTGITMPITKQNYLITRTDDIPRIFKEAFHVAQTGRPGPVLIDIPKDVMAKEGKFVYPDSVAVRGYQPKLSGSDLQVKKVVQAILKAHKPVLYIGGGVTRSGAEKELQQFAELLQIPVVSSLMGLSAMPSKHDLFLGMLGMHGNPNSNYAVMEADLLVAIGTRFSDRSTGNIATFAPHAKIIHIDVDSAEIRKNFRVDIPLVGDAKIVLEKILGYLETKVEEGEKQAYYQSTKAWVEQIAAWKGKADFVKEAGNGVRPPYLIGALSKVYKGDEIYVTDVGQHQMWSAQYCQLAKAKHFISSGGLGTMGFGFPAAVGAKLGNPEKEVILITGDGSFQMNMQELATVATYKVPVKIFIFHNQVLGMVRQWQDLFYERRFAATNLQVNPDFVILAKAFGLKAFKIEDESQVEAVLSEVAKINETVIVDVRIDKEEKVFPMVPAGKGIGQMILAEEFYAPKK